MFNIRNKVWLLTKYFCTTRSSKKLENKCVGPYTVSKVIHKNAYKFDFPKTRRNHNVIHISRLD